MGRTRNGLLRGTSGRVGPLVVADSDGDQSIVRILPKLTTKPPKQSQLEQRAVFKTATEFVRQNQEVLRLGFQAKGAVKPISAAASFILKNAVTGTYPAYKIDVTKVKTSVGVGGIATVPKPVITVSANMSFNLTWEPSNVYSGDALILRNQDELVLLLFNETAGFSFSSIGAATRATGTFHAHLPSDVAGDKVHAWLFFVGIDGKVSPSQHVGPVLSVD